MNGCDTGPTVYSPCPRRLESLTNLWMQPFLLSYFKTPRVGPAGVELDLPHGSPMHNRLSHWCVVKVGIDWRPVGKGQGVKRKNAIQDTRLLLLLQ